MGPISYIGSHIRLDGRPSPAPDSAPTLGQHSEEILRELGLNEAAINQLFVDDVLS